MDPSERWGQWQSWLGREPKGRTVYAQVVEMLAFRKIWRGLAAIYSHAPREATKNNTFAVWARWNYAQALGSGIRRQGDVRDNVVSLGRVINDVWRYPTVLTRERYVDSQGGLSQADGWFTDMAGDGAFMNPEIPAADLSTLRDETATIRDWVNNAVAHYSEKEKRFKGALAPPLAELHAGLDSVVRLFQKYETLIHGVAVDGDVIMPFWQATFRVPWITDAETYSLVVHEAEKPPE